MRQPLRAGPRWPAHGAGRYGLWDEVRAAGSQVHALEDGNPLVEDLAALGVTPDDIDTVLLTHLHFDHVGGAPATIAKGNRAYLSQGPLSGQPRGVGGRDARRSGTARRYAPDNLQPLAESGRLVLLDGDGGEFAGAECRSTADTRGTPGRQVRIGGADRLVHRRPVSDDGPSAADVVYGLRHLSAGDAVPQAAASRGGGRALLAGPVGPRSARWPPGYVACHPKREFVVEEPRRRL